ncbi:MAG: hypothetical protein J6Q67_04920 [Clostridia bacterium]|nr:hypothetical protein [Clostridia bacterium]
MDILNLLDIAKILWKRMFIIIITVVVFLSGTLIYCYAIQKPAYSAKATVLFASGVLFDDNTQQTDSEYITTAELSTSFALMKSFSGILTRSIDYYDIALASAKKAGLDGKYTRESLMKSTTIEYEESSVFLNITVVSENPNDAVKLVTALANEAPTTVKNHLARVSATVLFADERAADVNPKTAVMCVFSVVVAVVLSSFVVIMAEAFDKTIKNEDDFTHKHSIPFLGSVPDFELVGRKGKVIN